LGGILGVGVGWDAGTFGPAFVGAGFGPTGTEAGRLVGCVAGAAAKLSEPRSAAVGVGTAVCCRQRKSA
jgi:hypothetical protein